jgi:hypothetical protein
MGAQTNPPSFLGVSAAGEKVINGTSGDPASRHKHCLFWGKIPQFTRIKHLRQIHQGSNSRLLEACCSLAASTTAVLHN